MTQRVLISGAGVAGLCAALWLSRAGYSVTVVERTDAFRPGGYLVALSHHAYDFAAELGLLGALEAHDLRITRTSYHTGSGRSLLTLDCGRMFGGVRIIQLMREDLARILFDHVRHEADIRFGDGITAITHGANGVEAGFKSGLCGTYDLLIGADGLHSAVRSLAFPAAEIRHHTLGLKCAAFRSTNVLGLDHKFETHMEPTRYMATFTTRDDMLGNVFIWAAADEKPPADIAQAGELKAAFAGTGRITARVLDECPTDDPFYFDIPTQIEMPRWHLGRVVLVGDAAHALTLFSGRGASAAFAGASRLGQAIAAAGIESGLRGYEAEMRPVIDAIQPATRSMVDWYVPRHPARSLVRNMVMAAGPARLFERYFQMKYSHV